jgi:hypothetical protein
MALAMRLRKLEWFALVVALVSVTVGGVYGFRKIPELQLAGMLLWLVLGLLVLIGVAVAIEKWPQDGWRALVILDIALGGFILEFEAGGLGAWYRDRLFLRDLASYQHVVEGFRSGALPPGVLSLESLPAGMRPCCYRVVGDKDATGRLFVEFWTERGFPVKHSGWLYYAGDSVRGVARERAWYSGYRVAPHWYHVSD